MKYPVPRRQWANSRYAENIPTALPVLKVQNSPISKLNEDIPSLTPSKQWVVGSNPSRDALILCKISPT